MQVGPLQKVSAGESRLVPSHESLCRHRIRASQKDNAGRRRRQHHGIGPLAQCLAGSTKIGTGGQRAAVEQQNSPVSALGHRLRPGRGHHETWRVVYLVDDAVGLPRS